MGLLREPAVILCPPLPPETGAPPWLDAAAEQLERDGVVVVRASGPIGATTPRQGDGSPTRHDPTSPDPVADRLAIAGWVADQAIAITAARLDRPLLLASSGAANRGLPALGFSQRAARHSVVGYVMVDGPVPTPGRATADWPDAPVLYVRSPSAPDLGMGAARLRGWRTVVGDPVVVVGAHVRAWPELPS